MEEGKAHEILQDPWFPYEKHLIKNKDQWLKVDDDSSHENSMVSDGSSVSLSSCDTTDDASSSLPSSSSNSSGSLYDLSELMVQLPIKRGLSKFYQGRSESFTSLSRVTSVEDLAKKTSPLSLIKRKTKGRDQNNNSTYKPYILPNPIISKTKKDHSNKIIGSRPWPPHKKIME